jgi:RHS repeat-associated protein
LLKDYLDPAAVIDTSAAVVERFGYDAFGPVRFMDAAFAPRSASALDWNFLFHAEFLDTDSGLYNYGFRYYHPELGRWLSRDPFGENGGLNLYGFVKNKPVMRFDVLGTWDWDWAQYVPICGTVYAIIYTYPGESEDDYNGEIDCDGCDDEIAEINCANKIKAQLSKYLSNMANTGITKTAVDLTAAAASCFAGPPGWIAGGVLTIDGIAGAAAFAHNAANMKRSAEKAIEDQCHCDGS